MADERLVKKYPNRRLYDTSQSRYITRDELREMVCDDVAFKVVEQQSGEDITRSILLQIFLEQESARQTLLSTETLTHFVRHYGATTQSGLAEYLESSLRFFKQRQCQIGTTPEDTPLECWMRLGKQNIKIWQEMTGAAPGTEEDHHN